MQTLYIHPENPQARLISQAVKALQDDKLLMIPTPMGYVFALSLSAKTSADKLAQSLNDCRHVLVCRDLSQISTYASMDDAQFLTLKAASSTPNIFILPATKSTPKKYIDKNKTIGIYLASTAIELALIEALGEALVISTPDEMVSEPYVAEESFPQIDVLIDVGSLDTQSVEVINLNES